MKAVVLVAVLAGASCWAVALAFLARSHRSQDLSGQDSSGQHRAGARSAPGWFSRRLTEADDLEADRLWPMWLAGIAASFGFGWWIAGSGLGAVAAGAWTSLPLVAPRWLARRGERRRAEAVPHVLDAVARGLRSGASLIQALEEAAREAGALRAELSVVVAEAQRGVGVAAALDSWSARRPNGPIRLAAASLAMGAEAGGATARTVEGVAATVRQRLAVAGETRALTSQARISAQVMALAPLGFCAIGAATDPALARFLFVTPLGWVFLLAGASLDVVGALWMRRLASS